MNLNKKLSQIFLLTPFCLMILGNLAAPASAVGECQTAADHLGWLLAKQDIQKMAGSLDYSKRATIETFLVVTEQLGIFLRFCELDAHIRQANVSRAELAGPALIKISSNQDLPWPDLRMRAFLAYWALPLANRSESDALSYDLSGASHSAGHSTAYVFDKALRQMIEQGYLPRVDRAENYAIPTEGQITVGVAPDLSPDHIQDLMEALLKIQSEKGEKKP